MTQSYTEYAARFRERHNRDPHPDAERAYKAALFDAEENLWAVAVEKWDAIDQLPAGAGRKQMRADAMAIRFCAARIEGMRLK